MDQEYVRKEHIIRNMAGDVVFTGKCGGSNDRLSINAAKRESRKLQGQNLGCGILKVAA